MHREETEELAYCSLCKSEVVPGTGQAFAYGDGQYLCPTCTARRGGHFDAKQERWTTPPDMGGLDGDRD